MCKLSAVYDFYKNDLFPHHVKSRKPNILHILKNVEGDIFLKKKIKVIILSRLEAIEYMSENLNGQKTAVVSISTPGDKSPVFKNKDMIDAIYLKFYDIEAKYGDIYPARHKDVKNVKEFIDKNKDLVNCILVHCDAGVSRSSAMAAAICDYLEIEHDIFFDGYHVPNSHVYRLMCQEFGIAKDQEYFEELFEKYNEFIKNDNNEIEL